MFLYKKSFFNRYNWVSVNNLSNYFFKKLILEQDRTQQKIDVIQQFFGELIGGNLDRDDADK